MSDAAPGSARRPGVSAGISPAHIVTAAKTLNPEKLTIQAVADRLGVDRKAVVYHVRGRDGLMELLALDTLSDGFDTFTLPDDATWQESLRALAVAMRDALVASGVLVNYFRFDPRTATEVIAPAEAVMTRMVKAGFTAKEAGRGLSVLANWVMGHTRDIAMNTRAGGHPQKVELADALDDLPEGEFGVVRDLLADGFTFYDEAQFEFGVDVILHGLEAMLEERQ